MINLKQFNQDLAASKQTTFKIKKYFIIESINLIPETEKMVKSEDAETRNDNKLCRRENLEHKLEHWKSLEMKQGYTPSC